MRLWIIGALLLLSTTTAAAQSRWTLSAGPEWQPYGGNQFIGGRVRGEYDLIKPDKPLRLRLELGGYWAPTQNYYVTYAIPENGTVSGRDQSVDLAFGMTAAFTPLPKARVAPYVAFGVLAQQVWAHGESFITTPDTNTYNKHSGTEGRMILPLALGVHAVLGRRMYQVEIRTWEHRTSLLIGTSLPF